MRRTIGTTTLVIALVAAGGAGAGAAVGFVEPDVSLLYTLEGRSDWDTFGWVGADLGDVDGDGAHDFAIGAIFDEVGGANAGRVTVHSGATGEVLADHLGDPQDLFGWSVSVAGDVDGDGVPDYVVGAPGPPPGFGLDQPGRAVVFSGADHDVIREITSVEPWFFGASVSAAGDVDGDGLGDVLVGAPIADVADPEAGQVAAYAGADGSVLWTVDGARAGDRLGSAAGLVGDVDGDGVADVSVGATGAKHGRGVAYVLSGADGSRIHQLNPQGDGQQFGRFFAAGAGDVDGDGVPDVFVGDYAAGFESGRPYPVGTGAAYVFSGATGERIHRFDAPAAGDGFGPGRGIGDVDADGHADLVIAGYTSSDGAPGAGQATVYSGADGTVLRTITSTRDGENLGVDAFAIGDVSGDGLTDFVLTATGHSFVGEGPGVVYVVAGTPLG